MKAVIMAGGKGTRILDITKDYIPKPMIQIMGKPILLHQIEKLKENEIRDIIIVINHLGEQIQNYFGDGSKFGVRITYIKEDKPLGTGGSLSRIYPFIYEDFFLIYGDLIFDIDFYRMYKYHIQHRALATLFVHPNSHPFDSDLIITNKENQIIDVDSKENKREYWYHNCTNAGIFILNPLICMYAAADVKISLEDVLWQYIPTRKVYAYHSSEYVHDMGTLSRYKLTYYNLYWDLPKLRNLHNPQAAIFLDRDGVINKEKGLISRTDQFELLPNVAKAINIINNSSYLAIVVTNQPVVARGLCTEEDLGVIHDKMETLLGREGAYIDKIYYCPHHPDDGYPEENPAYKIKCNCRKPDTGMILQAADKFNIDLSKSWIIGDRDVDIQTGFNAGLKTIFLRKKSKTKLKPNYIAADLLEAVSIILGEHYES